MIEDLASEKIKKTFGQRTRLARLLPLAGDASSRRYHRAFLEGDSSPPSIVIMELGGSSLPLSSEELALFRDPPKELPFLSLHRYLAGLGVRIPSLYGHWVDEGILMLEDLGDQSLWDEVQSKSASEVLKWYEKAIDQLLLIQIKGTKAKDDFCIAFQQRFDFNLYMWEFGHFMEYGLEKRQNLTVSPGEKKILRESFQEISRHLDRQPLYLNHRDYHSWNLMVHRQEVVVIDFQDALLATRHYDLASLLNDRETDRIVRSELEDRLIEYYLGRSHDLGEKKTSKEEFYKIYLLCAIQRDLKVVGRFYYLDIVKGKPGYMRYIPATLERLKRNLKKVPSLENLASVLASHFQEMQ